MTPRVRHSHETPATPEILAEYAQFLADKSRAAMDARGDVLAIEQMLSNAKIVLQQVERERDMAAINLARTARTLKRQTADD